jgi:hypothetical protein
MVLGVARMTKMARFTGLAMLAMLAMLLAKMAKKMAKRKLLIIIYISTKMTKMAKNLPIGGLKGQLISGILAFFPSKPFLLPIHALYSIPACRRS